MDTITRQDLVQLGYKSETSRKIIAQAKSILIKRGYIFYDNKRLEECLLKVEVRDGALKGLTGVVVDVDHEKQKVFVKISMFGREVISDLDAVQVRKKS